MKNKTKKRVGIVAVMVMLVVAIAATAGTTLAKYIYSATVNDRATVAKWGYTVSANTMELFSKQYDANKMVTTSDGALDVKAEAKVVAPGTSNATSENGGQMTLTFNGTSDVAAQLILDITEFDTVWLDSTVKSIVTGTDDEGSYTYSDNGLGEGKYYPIQWTLKANDKAADLNLAYNPNKGFNAQLAESLVSAFNYDKSVLPTGVTSVKLENGTQVVIDLPAGTTFENFKLSIAWEWAFEKVKTPAEGSVGAENYKPATYYDIEDTILGALAAGKTTYLYTSADNGKTITNIDLTKYTATESNTYYNLSVKFGLHATLVQVQTAD